MPVFKNYFFLFVLLTLVSCSFEDTVEKIPLEKFFSVPIKTSFLVSPDGKFISYLKPDNNRIHIYVETWDGKNTTQLTCDTNRSISNYFWASNNEILYLKSGPEDKDAGLFAVKIDGSNKRELLPFNNAKIRLITTGRVYDDQVLVALNRRDSTVFDAYRLNIQSGKLSLLLENPGNITKWYSDPAGKLRMAIASDGVNETLLYRDVENQRLNPVLTNNFKTSILPVAFSADNSCIYALSNQNRDKMALVELDCKSGKEHRTIYSNPEVDVSEAIYSVNKDKLIYAGYETWKKERHYLDDTVKSMFNKLEKLLPNTEIRVSSSDSAERKFIIRSYTDRNPGSFYQYTPGENKLVKLSDINSSLAVDDMSEMKPVSFKTRDSLTVNGYLTLPKGKAKKNLPVVVMPHGGPDSRNSWGYNSEVQFLANRGYAVFQVNFRGSKGYGKKFWIAGFKEWGGKMQDDITDGVRWLISEQIADSSRIAIYGSSFGGFSALHGLISRPDLYQCGASYSGFTNLFTYLKDIPPYFRPYQQMYYETVGNPETDADYFRAVSPVFHTDKIKVPVLIAQGARDPRVNMNETNQFVKELKKRKVPVTYILKEDEGHFFRNIENRLEFYRELEIFLDKNLSRK
ncbi:Dipeptidyl aminopeptidase/acylaminoacyl peptidase [Daejeonella rubra]|uniref:Dipeptidyl aminopeptidase/acylaminoacyl peptidase n=1 Tax=Daejeonella rubra TaxID=990371 RepID=A0A1G9U3Z3_9SPHI|nr:S9 family peptidase [Daejeonella rubra]SDM54656.1 Dipeptidyl aminopeptidase/acylaminoacyl peptidase [Daejeonella rubra]